MKEEKVCVCEHEYQNGLCAEYRVVCVCCLFCLLIL